MLGVSKKSGIINRSLLYDEFLENKSLVRLNWDIIGSISALILFMVHNPFNNSERYVNKYDSYLELLRKRFTNNVIYYKIFKQN